MPVLHQACGSGGINKQTYSWNSLTKDFQMRGPLWYYLIYFHLSSCDTIEIKQNVVH